MNKERIISILTESFAENPSVNYVVKQDKKRMARIASLMEYSYFQGKVGGDLFYNAQEFACAIVIDPEKRKPFFKSVWWDLKLVFQCIGIRNVRKVLKRQKLIKLHHPSSNHVHLWYIGVDPTHQGKGFGSTLLTEIIKAYKSKGKHIILETSNPKNFPFYERHGFTCVAELTDFKSPLRVYELKH